MVFLALGNFWELVTIFVAVLAMCGNILRRGLAIERLESKSKVIGRTIWNGIESNWKFLAHLERFWQLIACRSTFGNI